MEDVCEEGIIVCTVDDDEEDPISGAADDADPVGGCVDSDEALSPASGVVPLVCSTGNWKLNFLVWLLPPNNPYQDDFF